MAAREFDPATIDLSSPDTFAERIPFEYFDYLRQHEPVYWHPEDPPNGGFWVVTKHEDLVQIHRDFRTFSSELGHVAIEELQPDELAARQSMLETDPPKHTRLRRIVSQFFTPRAVAEYEGFARQLARELLDEAVPKREFDFVEEIAAPFPINVLVRIVGAPPADAPRLVALGDRMIANTDPDYADVVVGREDTSEYRLLTFRSPAAVELAEYGRDLAAKRRAEPQDDLVSKLVHAEVDGERLTEREFANFFALLVIAGNETTRQGLSRGMLALASEPEAMAELAADPSLIPVALEEILRFASPVLYFRRTATVDTELRGVKIRAGDKVTFWYVSANFDEDVFPDPYTFDIRRQPNEHVTFGKAGPHHCLGAYLARLEMRVLLEELLPRVRTIEVTAPAPRVRSNFINGVKRMPVRMESAG
jgi:cytochrome P450